MRRSWNAVLLAAALAVLAPAGAARAGVPGATTGEATAVSESGAQLEGVANPNKEETTVHFEYGLDTAYGSVTPPQAIGGGNAGKAVVAAISGLTPATTYHFRLVSTNASGSDYGQDKTFTTLGGAAQPPAANTVTIAAAPVRVRFGRTSVLSGQVTGDKAAGTEVTVEFTPAPFTDPFKPVGPPVTADAAGAYSVTVTPTVNTRYQATAKTSPRVTSTPVQVNVAPAISLRVSDTRVRRGQRVRFSGRVRPAHDGATAKIQRKRGTGPFRTVAQVVLTKSATAGESRYSRRVRIRRSGVYRVRLAADADHVAGKSRKRRIRAR